MNKHYERLCAIDSFVFARARCVCIRYGGIVSADSVVVWRRDRPARADVCATVPFVYAGRRVS